MMLSDDDLRIWAEWESSRSIFLSKCLARLRAAEGELKFYADSYNYGDGNGMSWECTEISKDRGKRARDHFERAKNGSA